MFRRIRRWFKYSWQRKWRGFDDSETWSLDITLAYWIVPRLKRFKKVNNGYPSGLTEDKWNETIDKMIRAFEIIIKDDTDVVSDEEWTEFAEGFKLFHDHFRDLWW